jgi:hypothetical protein
MDRSLNRDTFSTTVGNNEGERNNWIGDSQMRQLLIRIMRQLDDEGFITIFLEDVPQEHVVSRVSARLIDTVYPVSPFALQDCIYSGWDWDKDNVSENVDITSLDDERWLQQNVVHVSYVNGSEEDYSETNRITALPENAILLRHIWDYGREDSHIFSLQIIWSSKYTWSGLMERLQDDKYDFDFMHEAIHMRDEFVDEASEVVDNLPTVIISDALNCVICQEPIGDSAKQLPCNHLHHSHCIVRWFRVSISCPLCRDESASNWFLE